MEQVAEGVFLVHGTATNWTVVVEDDAVTLVDTGYPADREAVVRSLELLGRKPGDVAAVLVTHAHTDHIGAVDVFTQAHGTCVLMHEQEVPHARREFLDQVTAGKVLANGWRPGVLSWARHAIRAGGTTDVRVPGAEPFPAVGPLDLPGRPVPVPTPGHTPGHCAYHLPDTGVLVTGDALVTAHPTSRAAGPQLLLDMFHGDPARTRATLNALAAVPADTLLPGHGPVHRGSSREAVEAALERALTRRHHTAAQERA